MPKEWDESTGYIAKKPIAKVFICFGCGVVNPCASRNETWFKKCLQSKHFQIDIPRGGHRPIGDFRGFKKE
jgi:hypothetical protein